jgi:hypothetical protein
VCKIVFQATAGQKKTFFLSTVLYHHETSLVDIFPFFPNKLPNLSVGFHPVLPKD